MDKSNPLITIFIPTYKRPQLLKRAIESALSQTWENIKIVVCDNASGDNTASVVSEFRKNDSRVHYFCHPTNIGMLANYEFAISTLDTDFFSFLSDDDLLLPCFCETALEGFSHYPDISFFAGSTVIVSKENGVLRVPLELWPREGLFQQAEGLSEMIGKYPVPTTVLFRKSALVAKIDYQNQAGWDCDFLIQQATQFPFAISKKPCGIMRSHSNSFTAEQSYEVTVNSIKQCIARAKKNPYQNESLKFLTLKGLDRQLKRTLFDSILSNLVNNRIGKARKTSYEVFSDNYFNTKSFSYLIISLICSIFPFMRFALLFIKKLRNFLRAKEFARQGFEKYQKFVDTPLTP